MRKKLRYFALITLVYLGAAKPVIAQDLKACEIVTVQDINKVVGTNLQYDPNSIINKNGKFECRFTDPKLPGTYIAIGLLSSKIEYGFDLLKSDFESNTKAISNGGKAGGKFTKYSNFQPGGNYAFYMTGEKTDYGAEAFVLKFRKGNYIITISAENIPVKTLAEKAPELYKLFSKM